MGVVVHLNGRLRELPPLVTVPLNRCDDPVVTAVCVSVVYRRGVEQKCGGLLGYQSGRWQHVNVCRDCLDSPGACFGDVGHVSCTDPEPGKCAHPNCDQEADIEMPCALGGVGDCDGCCWVREDRNEGLRLWPV
jgi:hypothetical protein